ncbi:MAG: hypothetical protein Q7Q71_15535 [Verrucomicrobiota bacterium JB023]|nr:hypothetical protein [Verrucomicrobiota bacterium JB023]
MKKQESAPLSIEEEALLENDPVWDLLDQSPSQEAGPFFSRNVLREIRLSEEKTSVWARFGQLVRSPKFALPALAIATGATVLFIPTSDEGESVANVTAEETTLQAYMEEEMLLAAADDPDLLSDEDLIALLF